MCLPWTKCTEHTNTSAFPLPKHARPGSCPRAMSRAVIDCSFSHALRRSKVSKGSFVCSHTSQLVSSHCCDLPTFCCLVPRASNADPESPPGLQFPIVRFGKLRGPLGRCFCSKLTLTVYCSPPWREVLPENSVLLPPRPPAPRVNVSGHTVTGSHAHVTQKHEWWLLCVALCCPTLVVLR